MSDHTKKSSFEDLAKTWAEHPDTAELLVDDPITPFMDCSSEEDFQKLEQVMNQQAAESEKELAALTGNMTAEVIGEFAPELEEKAVTETEETDPDLDIAEEGGEIPNVMDLEELQSCLEALLFISDKPLAQDKLRSLLGPDLELSLFDSALQALQTRYQSLHHGIELVEVAGGFQFRTKPGRAALAKKLVRVQTQRLSSGSMETLAIIAFQQPAMKEDVDKIRGVDSSYFVRGLLERKLIKISGRSELPGRPMLYGTTPEFLEIFGLKDLSSLPSLRELEQMIPASQAGSSEDDDPRSKEIRRLVGEMKADKSSALHYNPKEDEKILKDFRDQINLIPTSTPYLDQLKEAEALAALQAQNPPPLLEAPVSPD
jgi:segregation and condensation protein B